LFGVSGTFKYTKLTIAENCETATANDSLVTSITQSSGTDGTLASSDTITLNINTSQVAYKWVCLKIENSPFPGSSVITNDF
jgi:hypothetical protein